MRTLPCPRENSKKGSVFVLSVLVLLLTPQFSIAFGQDEPKVVTVTIKGPAVEDEGTGILAQYFNVPIQFDVPPALTSYAGTIECWRKRPKVVWDSYEGSTPIIPKVSTGTRPTKHEQDAKCAMHSYTDSEDVYYVKVIMDSATGRSEEFKGIDYPLYVLKKSYKEDKIFDGRTMEDCLANQIEQSQRWTDLSTNWTVEPIVTVQMVKYTFSNHKASINAQGAGVGITFKYYPDPRMIAASAEQREITKTQKDGTDATYIKFDGQKDIRRIKGACRATSFDQTNKLAGSLLSVGPVVFVSKPDTGDTQVQLGVVVGFFENLVQIGLGMNVSPNEHLDPFLMLGFAKGFDVSGTK